MRNLWLRLCFGVLLAFPFALSLPHSPANASQFPDRYDGVIRNAVKIYWADFPFWKSWKAQLWQESRLDPDAVSHAGARGIAQFMPGTWSDIAPMIGVGHFPSNSIRPAIDAGAYYMARLRRGWSSPRPAIDRHWLAAASYNAGFGHILKAQRLCGGPALYDEIIRCLPAVTGRHSRETITYVERIKRWWTMMESGL